MNSVLFVFCYMIKMVPAIKAGEYGRRPGKKTVQVVGPGLLAQSGRAFNQNHRSY
jgi:hypothetical protein